MKIGNLEVYGIIYKIENLVNQKVYIGQTIQNFNERYGYKGNTPIERVYNYHLYMKNYKHGYNKYLLRSIEKYGIELFEVNKILDIAFSKQELDIKENLWINYFNCIKSGYNWKEGGGNGKYSEESKKKMSESSKGHIPWNKGRTGIYSEETLNKIRESNKNRGNFIGKNNPNFGKNMSGKNNPCSKEVICIINKKKFNCLKEAEDYYGCSFKNISACCRGLRYTAGKLKDGTKLQWLFYEDYLNLSEKELEELINKNRNAHGDSKRGLKSSNASIRYIYDIDYNLLFKNIVTKCAEWLVINKYIGTIGSGKTQIARCIKNKSTYKNLHITDSIIL